MSHFFRDDWMPEMLDSYKPPNEPPKLISKKGILKYLDTTKLYFNSVVDCM